MTGEQWNRARAILEAAARRGPEERAAFVERSCAGDTELLRELEAMLATETTADLTATHEPEVAQSWGRFALIAEVGRGAFGRVYRANDPSLRRHVALKLIPAHDDTSALAESILHEGRLLTKVRHPNVVTVFGADHHEDHVGVWMEFIEGRTLADIIERDGPMGGEEAAVVGISLCSALAAVHAQGIVHRDVKARNVMREARGRIVLMDFGAGRASDDLPRHEVAGTPLYMAPEVLVGEPATPASDIYSTGVLLFYLVTGRFPVSGRTFAELRYAHERGDRLPLAECRPDLPDAFVRAVEHAMAPDPRQRYRSAVQAKHQLASVVASVTPPPGSQTSRLQRAAARTAEDEARHRRERAKRISERQRWQRRAGAAVAVLAGLAFCGFVTSEAFNLTLGRTGRFGAEPVLDWLIWGTRALIGPIVYMLGLLLVVFLLRSFVGVASALSSSVGRTADSIRERFARFSARAGLDHPSTFAHFVAVFGTIALVLVAWRSSDVLAAVLNYASTASPQDLLVLQPGNPVERFVYRRSLDAIILVLALGVYRATRLHQKHRWESSVSSYVIAVVVLLLATLMTVVPYRILFHNDFERVVADGARCYIIGRDAGNLLLHCPDVAPPRNRVMSATDPHLRREGIVESVFTPR